MVECIFTADDCSLTESLTCLKALKHVLCADLIVSPEPRIKEGPQLNGQPTCPCYLLSIAHYGLLPRIRLVRRPIHVAFYVSPAVDGLSFNTIPILRWHGWLGRKHPLVYIVPTKMLNSNRTVPSPVPDLRATQHSDGTCKSALDKLR